MTTLDLCRKERSQSLAFQGFLAEVTQLPDGSWYAVFSRPQSRPDWRLFRYMEVKPVRGNSRDSVVRRASTVLKANAHDWNAQMAQMEVQLAEPVQAETAEWDCHCCGRADGIDQDGDCLVCWKPSNLTFDERIAMLLRQAQDASSATVNAGYAAFMGQ